MSKSKTAGRQAQSRKRRKARPATRTVSLKTAPWYAKAVQSISIKAGAR